MYSYYTISIGIGLIPLCIRLLLIFLHCFNFAFEPTGAAQLQLISLVVRVPSIVLYVIASQNAVFFAGAIFGTDAERQRSNHHPPFCLSRESFRFQLSRFCCRIHDFSFSHEKVVISVIASCSLLITCALAILFLQHGDVRPVHL